MDLSDPFRDPSNLSVSGSPSSHRRVSFSIPGNREGDALDPRSTHSLTSGSHSLTNSPLEHSPNSPRHRIPSYPRAADPSGKDNAENPWLKSQLNKAFLSSAYYNSKLFLPKNAVDDLIRHENIENYWQGLVDSNLHERCSDVQCSDVIDYVCGEPRARYIFIIIVLIHEPELLPGLIRNQICDNDLPLCRIEENGADFQLARKSTSNVPIECCRAWTDSQRRSFDDLQWQVKVEVLGEWPIRLSVKELPDRTVLPFTKYERKHEGNSEVFRVEVHRAHHKFNNGTEVEIANEISPFALKVLKAEDFDAFLLEVKALMKIKPKKHLVTAVTAFKYHKKYHLLSKWADGGDLAEFWKTQSPSLTYSSICWLAQQCHGLADGLEGIHNASISIRELENDVSQDPSPPRTDPAAEDDNQVHGRHGDIKPENILWFSSDQNEYNQGILKITDFGVTAFHSARTTKVMARGLQVTQTYAAPEFFISDRDYDAQVSRPFDIWSLGCVYLEFITWILLGNEAVENFAQERMQEQVTRKKFKEDSFYSIHRRGRMSFGEHDYATVKKCVNIWIDKLKQYEGCSPFLQEFLDYIQKRMLVVDKEKREKCRMVRQKLRYMFDKCREDSEYAAPQVQTEGQIHSRDEEQSTVSYWRGLRSMCCL